MINFKKKIGLYLAFIMLFNVMMPFAGPVRIEVQAALGLSVNTLQGLTPGTTHHVPITDPSPSAEQARIEFSLPGSTDWRRLSFYSDTAVASRTVRIEVDVIRNFGHVEVVYRIFDSSGVLLHTILPAAHGYAVYSGPDAGFMPIGNYLGPDNVGRPTTDITNPSGDMVVTGSALQLEAGAYYLPPTFFVVPNGGFSFRYFGIESHITLTPDFNFIFAADRFMPGRIYDIRLQAIGLDGNPIPGEEERELFLPSLGGVTVQPFANAVGAQGDNIPFWDRYNLRAPEGPSAAHDWGHPIFHSRHPGDPPGAVFANPPPGTVGTDIENEYPRLPAMPSEPLGFTIGFYVPSPGALNTPGFIEPENLQGINASIILPGGDITVNVTVANIFSQHGVGQPHPSAFLPAPLNPGVRLRPIIAAGGFGAPTVGDPVRVILDANNNVIRLEVDLLIYDPNNPAAYLPSTLFTGAGSRIEVFGGGARPVNLPGFTAGGTPVENAYTLLYYGVTVIGGEYFIQINRTYGAIGQYAILESSSPNFPPIPGLHADHPRRGEMLQIGPLVQAAEPVTPIRIAGQSQVPTTGRYFQVFFNPYTPFTDDQINALLRGADGSGIGGDHAALANVIRSQVLFYRGDPDDLALRTPRSFTADVVSHVPIPGDLTRFTGEAEIRTTWDIASEELFYPLFDRFSENGTLSIIYDLNWGDIPPPYGAQTTPFARILVELTTVSGLAATPTALMVNYTMVNAAGVPFPRNDRGNQVNDGVELLWDGNPAVFAGPENPGNPHLLFGYMASVNFMVNTFHILERPAVTPPVGLSFPFVHFMNVQATQIGNQPLGPGQDVYIEPSESDSFTLSAFDDHEIPPPHDLRAYNPIVLSAARGDMINYVLTDQVSFDVSWTIPAERIRAYLINSYGMLSPEGLVYDNRPYYDVFDFWMTLYISQNHDRMADIANPDRDDALIITNRLEKDLRHDARDGMTEESRPNPDAPPFAAENILRFSEINGLPSNMTMVGHAGREPRDLLRNEESNEESIIAIPLRLYDWWGTIVSSPAALIPIMYRLDGLDKNQQYYVYADFTITQYGVTLRRDQFGQPVHGDITEASFLSNLYGIILPDDPDIPDGIDRDPPGVILNVERESVTLNSAVLYWDRVAPIPVPAAYEEFIEYEMIRIRDNPMSGERMRDMRSFDLIWNSVYPYHDEVVGWRTSGTALHGWTGSDWGGPPDLMRIMTERGTDPTIYLWDGSLISNTMYFYYIRVVRTVIGPSGTYISYSIWNHETLTTNISDAPRNLRVESEREYCRMTEVMLSFEAPIELDALPGVIAGPNPTVRFEYQLRLDDGEWMEPVVMNAAFLLQHARQAILREGDNFNWTWLLYHITGLEPGEMYSARVRMVELRNGEVISESMWSNIVSWLTDLDEGLEEERRLERDWIDYLRRRLHALLRYPYWIIRQDAQAFQVLYRTAMMNDIVAQGVGGQIHLPFENALQSTYYFPYAAFRQAWDAEMSFVLTNSHGNMRVSLPARSIDLFDNDTVIDTNIGIRRGEWNDYMVRFNVYWRHDPYIQGEESLSHIANIGFDLVSVTQVIGDRGGWEARLFEYLVERADEIASDERTLEDLRRAIRDQTPAEDISREMVYIVETIARQALARVVEQNFRDLNSRSRILEVPRLDRSMAVSAIADPHLAAISAFQSQRGDLWNNVATVTIGDSQGIFSSQPGFFAFAGRIVQIQGIEQVQGGPVATGVVARHGLDDFFGRADMNVAQVATRSQLINSVARMMGAPRGTDAVPWLRQNGVTVLAAGANNPITYQSALDMMMNVYAAQTGTRVDSLRISNFAIVNNLPGLDQQYRTSVAAAIELGLVSGHGLQPGAQMTVGSMLEILANLDRRIGL